MDLQHFLEHVYDKKCCLQMEPDRVQQIHGSVQEIVQEVARRIGAHDHRLKISDIIGVGSFAEGTKIRSPNEFDYMLCLEYLSHPDRINIQPGCHDGFKVVFLTDKDSRIMGYKLYGENWCLCRDGIKSEFRNSLQESVEELTKHCITKSHGQMVIKKTHFASTTISLQWRLFKNPSVNDPANNSKFSVCELEETDTVYDHVTSINIDLMPSVIIKDTKLVTEFKHFPDHYKDLLQERGCHLVMKACETEAPPALCFQISFASCEVYLMQNLHIEHKKCYQILKYLLVEGTDIIHPKKSINLSSYTLKTAMLYHEYENGCEKPPQVVKCMYSVIKYLKAGFRNGIMPSFFIRNVNVWGLGYRIPIYCGWVPSEIDENVCCRAIWSQILWLEFWRQVLGRALEIFKEISNLATENMVSADTESSDYKLNKKNPRNDEESFKHLPNPYNNSTADDFLKAFQALKDIIISVTRDLTKDTYGPRTEHLKCSPPKQEDQNIVLPSFDEYINKMEQICKIKIPIPRDMHGD